MKGVIALRQGIQGLIRFSIRPKCSLRVFVPCQLMQQRSVMKLDLSVTNEDKVVTFIPKCQIAETSSGVSVNEKELN